MSVLVAVPVHERGFIVRHCLATLTELLLPPGSRIVLFDDASRSLDAASLVAELKLDPDIDRRPFRLGPDAMIYFIWSYFLAGPHSELFFLDSDLIVNRRAVLDGLDYLAGFPGLLSLYNSRRHPVVREAGDLVFKTKLGNAGTLWRRDVVRLAKQALRAGDHLDDLYSTFFVRRGVALAATGRSRVQHLGLGGGNNRYLGDFDHGLDFTADTPLQWEAIAALYDELMRNQDRYIPPKRGGEGCEGCKG